MSDVFMPAHNDTYQLLGWVLRDASIGRLGQIVGIDLQHDKPVLDILWQSEKKPVRVTVTKEQFNQLLQAQSLSQQKASSIKSIQAAQPINKTTRLNSRRRA